MDEKEREGEIKIKDKRRFTPEGEEREPDEDTGEKQAEAEVEAEGKAETEAEARVEEKKEEPKAEEPPKAPPSGHQMPPLDFATFILSLATSAQVHLGAIPNPQTGKQEQNFGLAKETIDLLEILKEKTKGNLTKDEERLFEHLLYDLRMMYVERSKKG